jgi:hypothetical protein
VCGRRRLLSGKQRGWRDGLGREIGGRRQELKPQPWRRQRGERVEEKGEGVFMNRVEGGLCL